MITKLKKNGNEWTWRNANNSRGIYYTDKNGQGIFFQSDCSAQTRQITGTCQFNACETVSGTRRKLNKIFDEFTEDPRI